MPNILGLCEVRPVYHAQYLGTVWSEGCVSCPISWPVRGNGCCKPHISLVQDMPHLVSMIFLPLKHA